MMESLSTTPRFIQPSKELNQKHGIDAKSPQTESAVSQKSNRIETKFTINSVKKQFNQSILQANLEVNVSVGNEPLALLYKAAIEGINKELEVELGENALQNSIASGLDVSPEATADRIVSLSTGFFSQYQKQNPELSDENAALAFSEIITKGIDKGFADARSILEGLKVLDGEIATNIDKTYNLVLEGLQIFVARNQNIENSSEA